MKLDRKVCNGDGGRLYKTMISDNGEFMKKVMADKKEKIDANQQKMFSFLPK